MTHGDGLHSYSFGRKFYRRVLGEATPRETFTGRESRWRGSKMPRPGVQDADAANRVLDMDDEGTDVHFLIPGSFMSFVGLDDPAFEVAMARAYHRHIADFCGQFPNRLKSLIVASARVPEEAVREIREWGNSKWAVAVKPLMPTDIPPDHPDLEPIWRAAEEHDLPIAHHSSTWNPPYYPAYRDVWDNIFLGRLASHPWGAMRFVASFHRRRHHGPLPEPQNGRARMRFRLAAVLGAADGRAGGLCRRHRAAQTETERIPNQRPLLLQHRAPGRRGHVEHRHRNISVTRC